MLYLDLLAETVKEMDGPGCTNGIIQVISIVLVIFPYIQVFILASIKKESWIYGKYVYVTF